MKAMVPFVVVSSLVGWSVSAHATGPVNLLQSNVRGVSDQMIAVSMPAGALVPRAAVTAPQASVSVGAPVNLLPNVACFKGEPAKACDARRAAQHRAVEVTIEEGASLRRASAHLPVGLLIPVAQTEPKTIPPKTPTDAVCDPRIDPRLTEEQCARLRREFGVPGPVPPTPPAPAIPPASPTPPISPIPPEAPKAPEPPVVADPEAVIKPPPTGDQELVQPPPSTASKMPVIKPKPNPPVIQ